jgi:hypothetical protein
MRKIIYDEGSHRFIEGPLPSRLVNDSFSENGAEDTAYQTVVKRGLEVKGEDVDIPAYEVNQRFD